jgi:NAD(P)-dependent dehydrogenase (short-subunit alcohol dehydrogenase family)
MANPNPWENQENSTGRVLAITGAFGTLGAAVARAAAPTSRLALIDLAHVAPAGLPANIETLVLGGVDLTDPAQAKDAIAAILDRFGQLDALINVAGGFRWEMHEGGDPQTWRTMFRINVETAANATRAAIPALRASAAGRIVNVGANGAVKAAAGMGPYAASKAGVHKLTEALAEELKPDGVCVNAVLPSIIDTPVNRADMPDADFSTWVKAEDLAVVILFLASEEARAVTGALVPVTGRV